MSFSVTLSQHLSFLSWEENGQVLTTFLVHLLQWKFYGLGYLGTTLSDKYTVTIQL